MLFSELYGIQNTSSDEWFDPILHQDTKLFIDPFLIFKSDHPMFIDAYQNFMGFFNQVFELTAQSGGNTGSPAYNKAVCLLRFHEVNEICLGYSPSRSGAGPGFGSAITMADNIWNCIRHGINRVKHFEEIGLFNVGIGADHISDITANLLKEKLVIYTQEICTTNGIPMEKVQLHNGKINYRFLQWEHPVVELPINPHKRNGILLVPKQFLRDLPEINKDDFYSTLVANATLRADLNYEIDANIDKERIAQIAIENYGVVEKYISEVESRSPAPYNVDLDPALKYNWYSLAREILAKFPLPIDTPNNDNDFFNRVESIIKHFVDFVELNAGYKLLWDDKCTRGKSEEAVQLLFHGIVEQHCKANNIDLSREVNQGRGPVDFKFSNGYEKKILLEAKLVRNTKFWSGLSEQLPHYLSANQCKKGYFLAVAYTQNDLDKLQGLQEAVRRVNTELDLQIRFVVVDALPNKQSASNL